jgi:predicted negative regulator of RcsB-dependent stress response
MVEIAVMFVMLALGFVLGWHMRERHAIKQIEMILESDEYAEAVQETESRTKMRLERHGGLILAYVEEDNSFIAQGEDLEALDKAIQARFPGRKFSIQEQNLIDIRVNYHESV